MDNDVLEFVLFGLPLAILVWTLALAGAVTAIRMSVEEVKKCLN